MTNWCGTFVELSTAPVFMLKTDKGAVYILVYVDDLIILAPTDELLSSVLKSLHRLYDLRQMNDVTMFLGVNLSWTLASDGFLSSVALSQPRYITDVLRRFGMSECKPAVTPMAIAFLPATMRTRIKTLLMSNCNGRSLVHCSTWRCARDLMCWLRCRY
jgi:hypothetical protein